jgi:hypothetical protein
VQVAPTVQEEQQEEYKGEIRVFYLLAQQAEVAEVLANKAL